MSYYEDSPSTRFVPGGLTPAVRGLLAACVGLFLAVRVVDYAQGDLAFSRGVQLVLGLVPELAALGGRVWQFATYIFVHQSITHVLFNMLFLWWLGTSLESLWGTNRFLKYFLGTGIGAGIVVTIVSFLGPEEGRRLPVVGASGAVFGLLAAYGVCFKDNIIYVMMLLPMRAKYAVLVFGLIELLILMEPAPAGQPSFPWGNVAHLSGMALGYLYLHFEGELADIVSGKRSRRRRLKLVVNQPRPMDRRRYIEDQIDPILDKITASGLESLTKREREILERFRRES